MRPHVAPQVAVALALAIHELGTNARKYGALSSSSSAGRVRVEWATAEADNSIRLEWTESDGPAVDVPATRGFGVTLIEKSLAGIGGSARLRFEDRGLRCSIRVPLAENVADAVSPSKAPG